MTSNTFVNIRDDKGRYFHFIFLSGDQLLVQWTDAQNATYGRERHLRESVQDLEKLGYIVHMEPVPTSSQQYPNDNPVGLKENDRHPADALKKAFGHV